MNNNRLLLMVVGEQQQGKEKDLDHGSMPLVEDSVSIAGYD